MTESPITEKDPISVDYKTLVDPTADRSLLIEKGFGPDGLGIITVSGIPDFSALRTALLPLATEFARLPDPVKAGYEDAESKYNVGWSFGKETLQDGRPDAFKGSFYANPVCDDIPPGADGESHTYYARPNIWPRDHIPEFEGAFKSLGRLMYDVGLKVADLCDDYLTRLSSTEHRRLRACIERGACCCKARLLCYMPVVKDSLEDVRDDHVYWCGWHKDHCALTALCPALYFTACTGDRPTELVSQPADRQPETHQVGEAGLYVEDRHGNIVKVRIPPDHLAFQLGEAFQALSGNLLRATPHCVRAPKSVKQRFYRNTFALFMQPHWNEALVCSLPKPLTSGVQGDAVKGWEDGMTFGQFSRLRFASYYG